MTQPERYATCANEKAYNCAEHGASGHNAEFAAIMAKPARQHLYVGIQCPAVFNGKIWRKSSVQEEPKKQG